MQLTAPANHTPSPATPPLPAPLASLYYVMRAPGGTTREAQIDVLPDAANATTVRGAFDDALRAARTRAQVDVGDGLHRGAIKQAQAVLDAGEGAWKIVSLVGDHRGAIGPIFIDGKFYDKVGLGVHAKRIDGALQAIVGSESWMDLREPLRARPQPFRS